MNEKENPQKQNENIKKFQKLISMVLGETKEIKEEKIGFIRKMRTRERGSVDISFEFDFNYIEKLFAEKKELTFSDDSKIKYHKNYFEKIAIFERTPFTHRFRDDLPLLCEDTHNKIKYEFSYLSMIMFIHLLEKIEELRTEKDRVIRLPQFHYLLSEKELIYRNEEALAYLSKNQYRARGLGSIMITSEKEKSLQQFNKLEIAFRYNLAFSNRCLIIPLRDFSDLVTKYRSDRKFRRNLTTPKRLYDADIIYYYQMAISSDNPFLQFISFYHVMEYFFDQVYNEKIIDYLKSCITNPDFNYSDDKEYRRLVEGLVYDHDLRSKRSLEAPDKKGLIDTLRKYIPKPKSIADKIKRIDESLIDHYKTSIVSFSNGSTVNLNSKTNYYDNLADRINRTRNAIVHSSISDKESFKPFRDEEELSKEIHLMRILAEEIIHNSSKDLS